MSVGSQELDRSILQRKDRDELVAIAEAFGQKPPSRAKKADIVDLILDLTGVEPAAPAEAADVPAKPKRGRARPKAAEPTADVAPAATTNGAAASPSEDAAAEAGPSATTEAAAGDADAGAAAPATAAAEASAEATASTTEIATATPSADGAAGTATNGAGPAAEPATGGQGTTADGEASASPRAEQSGRGGGGAATPQHAPSDERAQDGKPGQPQGKQNDGQQQGKQNQQGRQGQQNQQGQQNHQGNQQGGGGEGEPGNRRRRRRNRDRDRDRNQPEEVFQGEPVEVSGLLDLRDEGYGFLRLKGYLPSKDDVYVSVKQVRQFGLRKGDHLKGASRPATRNEKNPALLRIDEVNGMDPEKVRQRPRFEDLTPLFPDEKLRLETAGDAGNMTARIVDLLSPIGKGQRGLIVSPPKAGKTTVMKTIARSIETNNPEAHLIVLLVDERPEEVTDFRRWLQRGEVAASTFDRPSDEHTHVAELVIERAKRMVEEGKDVVIILDGITRLARAYNLAAPASGRIMSGGIDAGALYPPKKFFGAARNVEEGGSLTILATALVETNSRMDDHIFEEFKGTGNMELKLDRKLADRRIYPAIDVDASGTRHEELLFERRQLQQVWKLRRVLSGLSADGGTNAPGLELLVDRMKTFKSNDEFLAEIAKAPSIS